MNFKNPKLIPPHIVEKMFHLDRKMLGIKTAEEMAKAWKARNERELQRQIVTYLREHRGIEVLWHGTHKKSTATRGWPDITFGVMSHGIPTPCAWEVKFGTGTLSPEQNDMLKRLQSRPNCWRVRIIRTFVEAVDELRELGL